MLAYFDRQFGGRIRTTFHLTMCKGKPSHPVVILFLVKNMGIRAPKRNKQQDASINGGHATTRKPFVWHEETGFRAVKIPYWFTEQGAIGIASLAGNMVRDNSIECYFIQDKFKVSNESTQEDVMVRWKAVVIKPEGE